MLGQTAICKLNNISLFAKKLELFKQLERVCYEETIQVAIQYKQLIEELAMHAVSRDDDCQRLCYRSVCVSVFKKLIKFFFRQPLYRFQSIIETVGHHIHPFFLGLYRSVECGDATVFQQMVFFKRTRPVFHFFGCGVLLAILHGAPVFEYDIIGFMQGFYGADHAVAGVV